MEVEVVLVNPVYQGNVGAVARVIKNFGYSKLALIKPCELGNEARAMASHAQNVLDSAQCIDIDDVFGRSNLVVGTTGVVGSRRSIRRPYPLEMLGTKLRAMRGVASILFGAEDQGLSNNVLRQCDMVIHIKTSPVYPVMNISHAVAVVLYSINYAKTADTRKRAAASHLELDGLLQHSSEVLEAIDFPLHKRRRVLVNLKRIYGRSELSSAEVRTVRGILRRIELHCKR
jgi:tRNA/rRNA methyltransferase